jgi:predicted dehydrogenase
MESRIDRRNFVKSAAGGLATATELAAAPARGSGGVRLGFIGVGGHGIHLVRHALRLDYVTVPAICDVTERNLGRALDEVESSGRDRPEGYSAHEESYLDMVAREDLDGVLIATPWRLHIPMCIAAMRAGKYAATEVGPASSIQECRDLVKAFEETGKPCMLLENHCFDRWNMALLRMVREGVFGELIHCQCGYEHDLRARIVQGKGTGVALPEGGDYRTLQNRKRNADLYPTHGIGPVANWLDIDRGNRFAYLTSTASKSRGLAAWTHENLAPDSAPAAIDWATGDVVTTVIKCANGETVVVSFDTRLPRPYSNMRRLQGTRGIWLQDGNASSLGKSTIYIDGRSPRHRWEPFGPYQEEFEHPLWRRYLREGVVGGHRGSDFLKVRAFADCVRDGLPTVIDAYDTASWMAISPLSERSIATGSRPVSFPDFTNGKWMYNKPIFGLTDRV